mgnify:CR=1 FL=1
MTGFLGERSLRSVTWQAFERIVARYLMAAGWQSVRLVGGSGDGGADVLATRGTRKWLVQVKRHRRPIGRQAFRETVNAGALYGANVLVLASTSGFTVDLHEHGDLQAADGINVQLWDIPTLVRFGERLDAGALVQQFPERYELRDYQEQACQAVVGEWIDNHSGSALVVFATGLGKTFVAATAIRRIANQHAGLKVLVLAHTNALLRQLEKAFWPFLRKEEGTLIAYGEEEFSWDLLERTPFVFASRDTLASRIVAGQRLHRFDLVLVDECHHLGAQSYDAIMDELGVGDADGPFLMGLTATDWRPDGCSLEALFGDPVAKMDLVSGLKSGFLTNVDYRMFTDNIDWEALRRARGGNYAPKRINRTLFIQEWDDAVIGHVQSAWDEIAAAGGAPRGIVFCSTIDHAKRMVEQLNAVGFTRSEALYSGKDLPPVDRNKLLWEFSDGQIGILCAVDVLNEGVDVPDVNLVVFQRVTHSRRIFVQQLGRGLRLAEGKDKVIVLDFVNDVRRFAEGLRLQGEIEDDGPKRGQPEKIALGSTITFVKANAEDVDGANFLRQWLGDAEAIADAGEDVSILRFPDPGLVPER